eukprot:scaffold6314_cov273-Ochromonas_danica.AAC.13
MTSPNLPHDHSKLPVAHEINQLERWIGWEELRLAYCIIVEDSAQFLHKGFRSIIQAFGWMPMDRTLVKLGQIHLTCSAMMEAITYSMQSIVLIHLHHNRSVGYIETYKEEVNMLVIASN